MLHLVAELADNGLDVDIGMCVVLFSFHRTAFFCCPQCLIEVELDGLLVLLQLLHRVAHRLDRVLHALHELGQFTLLVTDFGLLGA